MATADFRAGRSRTWRVLALFFALSLVAAACGGDDDDSADGDGNGGGGGGGIEAVEPFFPVDAEGNEVLPCGAFAFRPANKDFRDAFNEQLNAFREDGTTMEIITAYEEFSEADVEKANELVVTDIAANPVEGQSGGGLLEELQASGSITIGVANEVPFGSVGTDGEPTGIAPDVAKAVLAEMGIENVDAQVTEFGQLISGLQAGTFDMISAGMYITDERAAQVLFADPDYCVAEGLAVPAGNPNGIENYQSFVENPDLTLAVASGTVEVGYAEDAGIPDSQLSVFSSIQDMYAALAAGEVDAVSGTAATVQIQVESRS